MATDRKTEAQELSKAKEKHPIDPGVYTGPLCPIAEKLAKGVDLDFNDALVMFNSADVLELGRLAEHVTFNTVGCDVYFSVNRHINYTNICKNACKFCNFSKQPGQSGGYVLDLQQIVATARQAAQDGAHELHLVGGINPELPFEYYLSMIAKIRLACPSIHIKAFTAVEILDLVEKTGKSTATVLMLLIDAGLNALPGGGAEILSDDYFARECPNKTTPGQWLEVHAVAHQLGLVTNASMLFGYSETIEDRINHLLTIRDLQDRSIAVGKGKFQCFVPLSYQPGADQAGSSWPVPNAADELKTIAISRLLLGNIDHIKAFWPMLGLGMAQIALFYGADDLDGTVGEYRIVSDNNVPEEYPDCQVICELISSANRRPIQRDGLYRLI